MRNIEYEIIVWVGDYNSQTRDVGCFPITASERALNYFKESLRVAIQNQEGKPHCTIRRWDNSTRDHTEFADGWGDQPFRDLPKYVQKKIKSIVSFQSTIEY